MLFGRLRCSQKGQALVELALSLPLLLLLSLGAIEIGNMINTYLVLTHLTREGANLTSRSLIGTPANALDAIIAAAKPIICEGGGGCKPNPGQWRVIYSLVGPNPATGDPTDYMIVDQIDEGDLSKGSRIGSEGGPVDWKELGITDPTTSIGSGQTFNVIEVFYNYNSITPLESFLGGLLPKAFYERAIFTTVAG